MRTCLTSNVTRKELIGGRCKGFFVFAELRRLCRYSLNIRNTKPLAQKSTMTHCHFTTQSQTHTMSGFAKFFGGGPAKPPPKPATGMAEARSHYLHDATPYTHAHAFTTLVYDATLSDGQQRWHEYFALLGHLFERLCSQSW
jgi:hypothetical protein